MTAPRSDLRTTPQHHFFESWWSQHSETALKLHGLYQVIKLPKSSPWPTDYFQPWSFQGNSYQTWTSPYISHRQQ